MRTIKSAFEQPGKFEFCNDVFLLYSDINNSIDVARMSEHERVIVLAWHFGGIIDNGGFGYLYSANIRGDPHYRYTANAFKTLGCNHIVTAFEESFRWFPDNTPPSDVHLRRHHLALVEEDEEGRVSCMFFEQSSQLEDFMEKYIRTHRASIEIDLRNRLPVNKHG
jgi:hypothetical protein